MELVWHHTFYNELRVAPEEQAVMLSEVVQNPKGVRAKTVEVMFDTFEVPALAMASRTILTMYASSAPTPAPALASASAPVPAPSSASASASTASDVASDGNSGSGSSRVNLTGLVINSGGCTTHVIPLIDGRVLVDAIRSFEHASGEDLTNHAVRMLQESGYAFSSSVHHDREVVREIKEKLGYVAGDFQAEMKRPTAQLERMFELPDGQVIGVSNERFRIPEPIFQPRLLRREDEGAGGLASLPHIVLESIGACDPSLRAKLFGRVILAGGNTMFDGFASRLEKELQALAPPNTPVRIVAPPQRRDSAWIGGSIFASLSSFKDACINRSEYKEVGSQIIHRKCL